MRWGKRAWGDVGERGSYDQIYKELSERMMSIRLRVGLALWIGS